MNVVLWIIAIVLAVVFLGAGLAKITRPKDALAASRMGFVEDFSPGTIKAIGVAEVLAAIGLILPGITGIAPILVPLAASGLVLLMIGAIITHVRRKELPMVIGNVVLLILAAIEAWGRFGPYAF